MLLWEIEAFLRESAMAPTRFGRLAARDPRLVLDMRNGREPRPAMCRRVRAYMAIARAGMTKTGLTGIAP